MANKRPFVKAYLIQSLYDKVQRESKETGQSVSSIVGAALATRYVGDKVSVAEINREFEDGRLKDSESEPS